MKKFIFCVLILLAVFLPVCAVYAEGGYIEFMPQVVADQLEKLGVRKENYEDIVILDQVETSDCRSHLFVLAGNDGTHHTVYHFTNIETDENAYLHWVYQACYDQLAPQGEGTVCFYRHEHYDRYGENGNVQLYDDPNGFMIYRIDPEDPETYIQGVNVHVIDRQFQIMAWFDKSVSPVCSAYIQNGKLHYGDNETGKSYGTVKLYRVFDLNVAFSSLPKTYRKASEKYTDPAAIPHGELKAELVKFVSNKKYAVYSAPDQNSLRAAKGKAVVSTNDWIQVFGREKDWILIQYAIDKDHYRFGYISADALPKKTTVKQLDLRYTSAYTKGRVSVTDDPLYSGAELVSLPEGSRVTWLATMGEWAYIESSNGDRLRGFVPLSALRTEQVFELRNYPGENGPVYDGDLIIRADQTFSASFTVVQSGPLGNAAVSAVFLVDPEGNALGTAAFDARENDFFCTGVIDDSVTVIRFVAVNADGDPLDHSVSVQW